MTAIVAVGESIRVKPLLILDESSKQIRSKWQRKQRATGFPGMLLASVEADGLWEGGETQTETRRPVWTMMAASTNAASAFFANLMLGKTAIVPEDDSTERVSHNYNKRARYEILRGTRYEWRPQDHLEIGVKAKSVYQPDLCDPDPELIDPEHVRFVVIPRRAWVDAQRFDPGPLVKHVAACGHKIPPKVFSPYLSLAALTAGYLAHRTHLPQINDLRFFAQVFMAAIEHGIVNIAPVKYEHRGEEKSWGADVGCLGYREYGLDHVRAAPGCAFSTTQERLASFLAGEVATYRKVTAARATVPARAGQATIFGD